MFPKGMPAEKDILQPWSIAYISLTRGRKPSLSVDLCLGAWFGCQLIDDTVFCKRR
jgi:hypothetical protein